MEWLGDSCPASSVTSFGTNSPPALVAGSSGCCGLLQPWPIPFQQERAWLRKPFSKALSSRLTLSLKALATIKRINSASFPTEFLVLELCSI